MIKKEEYDTRPDGVKLFRIYSDADKYVIQNETGLVYADAIDVEGAPYTYSESGEDIHASTEELLSITLGGEARQITRTKARQIRTLAVGAAATMDDAAASTLPEMFPQLKQDGSLVKAGTRINWKGKLKKATVDLWDTVENNPDNAPELWESLNYTNGYRDIPEVITTALAFAKGEEGWWKGAVCESLYDSNVWNPEQFPAGWRKKIAD